MLKSTIMAEKSIGLLKKLKNVTFSPITLGRMSVMDWSIVLWTGLCGCTERLL